MKVRRHIGFSLRVLAIAASLLVASVALARSVKLLTRAQALAIARKAMIQEQLKLADYKVDDFVGGLSEVGKTWVFLFRLAPNGPPDSGFFADVDRTTGVAVFHPEFGRW